jgi:hypothetical protein
MTEAKKSKRAATSSPNQSNTALRDIWRPLKTPSDPNELEQRRLEYALDLERQSLGAKTLAELCAGLHAEVLRWRALVETQAIALRRSSELFTKVRMESAQIHQDMMPRLDLLLNGWAQLMAEHSAQELQSGIRIGRRRIQSNAASKKNEKARLEVQKRWIEHCASIELGQAEKQGKASFGRVMESFVLREFDLKLAAGHIATRWLSKKSLDKFQQRNRVCM